MTTSVQFRKKEENGYLGGTVPVQTPGGLGMKKLNIHQLTKYQNGEAIVSYAND